ncbi:L-threonine synthase [Magnetococcus marinus MC-1]|uniref:Threonine synthase n=1 Tax=Magnetococcus marinus (strain ATCC BAA-1437 / JCM 17883 / MC-1) TaxID=156889 RepID=A0L4U1_MAGMM|nr:threonine synthase [Magnetococcus marinus]ABK42984.1 L-threonine synthase [Magnetococcus marinus MC-1]
MRYISTRGGVAPLSFSEAVMMGLATDGGLLVPERLPQVDGATLRRWAKLSYQELALEVMRPFVEEDIPEADLRPLVINAYAKFEHDEITPLVKVGDVQILELFHGPTLAFKDVALQFLGNLFEYLLEKQGGRLNIIGATSGDTGSAAIHGVRGKSGIDIFILHPHQRVSPVQERQMTTVLDDNVHNIAIEGNFDDGQAIVKALFNDLAFKEKYHLGAVNSINWARILAQIVYYFRGWARATGGNPEQKVSFSVPTGNFGDIYAGYLARQMGLPVDRLILATNRNDILSRFVLHGSYSKGVVEPTISPSMDIQISSNFERYLFDLLERDGDGVKGCMAELAEQGGFSVSAEKLAQVRTIFDAVAVSEAQTLETITRVHRESGYVLDPHTAVGVAAAAGRQGVICLATAHPAKFADAVRQATGEAVALPPSMQDLMTLPTRCEVLPATAAAIKAKVEQTLA